VAYGLIKDVKAFNIRVSRSYYLQIKKVIMVIPFPPVLPFRFPPPRKLIPHLRTESGIALVKYQFCKGCVFRDLNDVLA
jgi:hypothetical protein